MSEHMDEQISEFIDDEMTVDACEFFVRRLQRDDEARSRYMRYQLIGAAVRGEHRAINAAVAAKRGSTQTQRSMQAERAETPVLADSAHAGNRFAMGVGIAASLVLVTVFGLRIMGLEFGGLGIFDGSDGSGGFASASAPRQQTAFGSDYMGMQYLMQHTGYTSGLSRTIMHSSVISGPQFEAVEEPGAYAFD